MYYMGSRCSQKSHGKGQCWGGNGRTIVKYRDTAVNCAKAAEPIDMPFGFWTRMGPSNHVLDGGPDPHGKGQFWWIGAPIVKHRDFLPWTVQKRLKRSIWRLGCEFKWVEGCTSLIVFARWRQCALMRGDIAATWRIRLNHPSIDGSDAPYVKLFWPLVTFGHLGL